MPAVRPRTGGVCSGPTAGVERTPISTSTPQCLPWSGPQTLRGYGRQYRTFLQISQSSKVWRSGYSPVPNAARVILSDGRPSLGSLLARFHELYSAVGEANALWWANSRHDEARTLSLASSPGTEKPAALIGRWLDVLGDNIDPKVEQTLRAWAEGLCPSLISAAVPVRGKPLAS